MVHLCFGKCGTILDIFWRSDYLSILVLLPKFLVGWTWRIRRLHLCRGVRPPTILTIEFFDMTLSHLIVSLVLQLWPKWCTRWMSLHPSLHWPRMVVLFRVPSMGKIELFKLLLNITIDDKVTCSRGVMVKVMDCGVVISEFEFLARNYVHFQSNTHGKGTNPFILQAMG